MDDGPVGELREHGQVLEEREVDELPKLCENRHLRSYEGDDMGRGAGIYDCKSDAFFNYNDKEDWEAIASDITSIRRQFDPTYLCTAPRPEDVCVIHLPCCFPYDIDEECTRVSDQWKRTWQEVPSFLCRPEDEMHAPDIARAVEEAGLKRVDSKRRWMQVHRSNILLGMELVAPQLSSQLDADPLLELDEEAILKYTNGVALEEFHWIRSMQDSNCVFVPKMRCKTRPLAIVDKDIASLAYVKPHSFVTVTRGNKTRYFKPYTRFAWDDCETPEIDKLLDCQHLGAHDQFFIWALLGRLFYKVGEFDNHEITLFIEGVGGTGKTTLMKAWQRFWPPHLRGTMSSNMQAQFGMSSVAENSAGDRAHVCFCGEVTEELSVVQEEWQDAVSGAEVSLARKFKEPLVMTWEAQFFWVGNQYPTRFNNDQGQVSRRLAGVLMEQPIKERDGSIMKRIEGRLGCMQRKAVLAYFEFVRLTGMSDPMGRPDALPPAFAEFYRRSKRRTNAMEDFLDCGTYVVLRANALMLLSEFKELYERYRADHTMPKMKWSRDVYRTSFHERSLRVTWKEDVTLPNGDRHTNVDVVEGVSIA